MTSTLLVVLRRSVAASAAVVASTVASLAQDIERTIPVPVSGEGSGSAAWALAPFEARRQLVVGASHLAGRAGEAIVGLAVRRDADNRGANRLEVFAGYVDLPAVAAPPAIPAPWSPPYQLSIPFQVPFRYTGGPLCIETETRYLAPNDSGQPSPPAWILDAEVRPATGQAASLGKSCIPGLPGSPAGASTGTLSLGETAMFSLAGPRVAGFGVFTLGAQRLDLLLDAAGAPGCTLHADWLVVLPSSIAAAPRGRFGAAQQPLPLPVAPGLAGARVVVQWMLVDPAANALQLTFSNGVEATLGRAQDLDAAWVECEDLKQPAGIVDTTRLPVVKLSFRR